MPGDRYIYICIFVQLILAGQLNNDQNLRLASYETRVHLQGVGWLGLERNKLFHHFFPEHLCQLTASHSSPKLEHKQMEISG